MWNGYAIEKNKGRERNERQVAHLVNNGMSRGTEGNQMGKSGAEAVPLTDRMVDGQSYPAINHQQPPHLKSSIYSTDDKVSPVISDPSRNNIFNPIF